MPLLAITADSVYFGLLHWQLPGTTASDVVRLLVIAPLLEEFVMRVGVQEWLIVRCAQWRLSGGGRGAWSVALAALSFSLLHVSAGMGAMLMVLLPGVLLALLYQSTRDWRICAGVHSLMNAVVLVISYLVSG